MMNYSIQQQSLQPRFLSQPAPTIKQEEEEVDLKAYFNVLADSRWLIFWIALTTVLLGVAYAFLSKPVYEANMMIQVEQENPNATKNPTNILGEMSSMFEVKAMAISEIELLRSRMVISHAVDNLKLYISDQPKYFPIVGRWLAAHSEQLSTPGIFGYGGYVWGSEKMDVSVFNVPHELLNQAFVVRADGAGRYRLIQEEKSIILPGTVGSTLTANTALGPIELRIDQLNGNLGAEFTLTRLSRLATIENVQRALSISEQGKDSGVIQATLQGQNPEQVNSTLNAIGREYMRQNQARKTEAAQKSLAFLDKQLPELKQQLEQSELKYNQFRNTHGTVDLSEEAKQSLLQSSLAKAKRIELQQKKTELLANFTDKHPAVIGVDNQLKEINNEIGSIAGHIKTLPLLEQNVLRLTRDIKVNTDLYTGLLNNAQQLRIATVGTLSNVRLVDPSMMPEKPLKPDRQMVIGLAALAGLFLGVVMAFMRKAMKAGIEDPQQIEQVLGIPVYATIPHSKLQKRLYGKIDPKSRSVPLLAKAAPNDIAMESLRNFRAALEFSMVHAKNNIVLMTGATPGLGKSFVSVNFAAVMASSGKRVILIDGDLRDGHLHQYFGLARENGLSDSISGATRIDRAIHRGVMENLDFLSTGSLPPNPSELLLRPSFGLMLQSLIASYDMILIDTAPILVAADPVIIGAHAGAIYIMARAEVTTHREIIEATKRLTHAGLSLKGVLFNDLKPRTGRYDYSYEYGQYSDTAYTPRMTPLLEAPGVLSTS